MRELVGFLAHLVVLHAHLPNGVLEEYAAIRLVKEHVKLTKSEKMAAITAGLDQCLRLGLLAVQSIEEWWSEYAELAHSDQLPIRVFYSVWGDDRPKAEERCGG